MKIRILKKKLPATGNLSTYPKCLKSPAKNKKKNSPNSEVKSTASEKNGRKEDQVVGNTEDVRYRISQIA